MASPIYVTQANLGNKIAFQSKNTKDLVQWTGILTGITTLKIASNYQDITSYNAAVQQADPTVGDPTTLNWFLISLINGTGQTETYAFANEWIAPGSFSLIQEKIIVNIAVYDSPTNDHQTIINQLQALGFFAVITSVTS